MLIGLTGGIAAGKSLVAKELTRLGAAVIDADAIARELLDPGTPEFKAVIAEFGAGILKEDNTINRPALASIIFSDKERRAALNAIMHPAIRKAIFERVEKFKREAPDSMIVIDAALLIENELCKQVKKVIVVMADEETLMARMTRRDNISNDDAKKRLASQLSVKEKSKYADYIIDNNGTPEEAAAATRKIYGELKKHISKR